MLIEKYIVVDNVWGDSYELIETVAATSKKKEFIPLSLPLYLSPNIVELMLETGLRTMLEYSRYNTSLQSSA